MDSSSPDLHDVHAPPGYSSQLDESSAAHSSQPVVFHEDIAQNDRVSTRSLPFPFLVEQEHDTSNIPSVPDAPATRSRVPQHIPLRRRHSSLPYDSSDPVTPRLTYHYVRSTTNTSVQPHELLNQTPPSIPSQTPMSTTPSSSNRRNSANYVSVSRKSTAHRRAFSVYHSSASITGDFTVNPHLHVPAALLSQASGTSIGDRSRYHKNLRFEVENGGINVNIFLVGDPSMNNNNINIHPFRTTLDLKLKGNNSTTFPIIARIHTPELPRTPFYLNVSGMNGYHSVHLPKSFHGLVTIAVVAGNLDSHISLSRGFFVAATIMNETSNARSYFVGELGGWSRDKEGWEGDRVDIGIVNGLIRLQFVDEKGRDRLRRLMWKFGF